MKISLVDDWRRAWRWFSVICMTLATALQGAWLAIPGDLKSGIPDAWISAASIGLLVLGTVGRLVKQTDTNNGAPK